jgi:CRISPR-associated endonuclease/helicase Cas3
VTILSSFNLFSHPDKTLREHLTKVSDLSLLSVKNRRPDFSSVGIDDKTLEIIVKSIALSHDFGKSTKYFQNYLSESINSGKKRGGPLTGHGLISAVFCWYITGKEIGKYFSPDEKTLQLIRYISYQVVKKHHGDLGDIQNELNDLNKDNEFLTKEQLGSIDLKSVYVLYDGLFQEEDINYFFENFDAILKDFSKGRGKFGTYLKKSGNLKYTLLEQYLFSLLISSDKSDASGIIPEFQETELDSYMAESYLKNFSGSEINSIRNDIFCDINSKAETLNSDEKIYSINVPTGGGKTLAALGFALKLRNRIKKERGHYPKIIYSLPFTSIIDQNFTVFEDVYADFYGKKPSTDILLKHHHLSGIFYKTRDDDEYSTLDSRFLIEGWNSEIIVTTFVQLFHSLLSNRNRALIKYHNIVNSIILLDEVQSIPPKYWYAFKEYLKAFSETFNVYFVFITATQPLIFTPGDEIKELCTNKSEYFRAFERTKLVYNKDPVYMDDFKEICMNDLNENPYSDFLFVMNTKNSASELYLTLKEGSVGRDSAEFIFLSTGVVPAERLKRIEKIKETKGKKRLIVVSTQLVEAGVDIDLDIVYRDLGPLDSINQVAGRCNRNSVKDIGVVKIFSIKNDNEKLFSSYIYDITLLDWTRKVLENYDEISESDFLCMNNLYFEYLLDAVSRDESKKILKNFCKLGLESASKNFKLIDDGFPETDVFVEADSEACVIWKKFIEMKSIKDRFERLEKFYEIKADFLNYVISVPAKHREYVGYDAETGMGYISYNEINQGNLYDLDTGYKPPQKDAGNTGSMVL